MANWFEFAFIVVIGVYMTIFGIIVGLVIDGLLHPDEWDWM
jgi:hypothetical protein